MTDDEHRDDSLRAEWLARRQAALKRRTAARLTAAETAFRAYSAQRSAAVPVQREPADGAGALTGPERVAAQ